MAVLIKDIAERIGVSEATVSMALRDRPAISQARRHEIQALAKKLNYRPNRMAQGLARGKTRTLGLIIGTLQLEIAQRKTIYMDQVADEAGYKLFISYSKNEPERVIQLAEELVACGVDGLFIVGNNIYENDNKAAAQFDFKVPTVFIDSKIPLGFRFNRVLHDKASGVEAAIKELTRLGHRNIYMLHSYWEYWWTDSRFIGFSNGLKALNPALNPEDFIYKICDEVFTSGHPGSMQESKMAISRNIEKFLARHPDCTAIICSSDNVAIAVMSGLQSRGRKIPEDISIVGIDNIQLSEIVYPRLSTISQPIEALITQGFAMMQKCLDDPAREPEKIIIPSTFIKRDSCGPAAGLT